MRVWWNWHTQSFFERPAPYSHPGSIPGTRIQASKFLGGMILSRDLLQHPLQRPFGRDADLQALLGGLSRLVGREILGCVVLRHRYLQSDPGSLHPLAGSGITGLLP